MNRPCSVHEKAQLEPTLLRIRDHLSPERFAGSWDRGSLIGLAEILDFAYAEADRGVAAGISGEAWTPQEGLTDALAGHGLTARELDVARLVATRLSDKEIAERLSISPRTVSTHVVAILGKLGVHSRRDVARFATDREPHRAGDIGAGTLTARNSPPSRPA